MSFDSYEYQAPRSEGVSPNVKTRIGVLPLLAATLFPLSCSVYRDHAAKEAEQKAIVEALYAKVNQEISQKIESQLSKAISRALSVFTKDELYSLVSVSVSQAIPHHLKIEQQHLAKSVTDEIMARITADNRLSSAIASWQRDPQILSSTMLAPTVQIVMGLHVGSGVMISKKYDDDSDRFEYQILSCWHTFREEMERYESSLILSQMQQSQLRPEEPQIEVKIYTNGEPSSVSAKIIYSQSDKDLSLLSIRSELDLPIAKFSMDYRESKVQVFSPVVAIGCPLGNDPIPSMGIVSDMSQAHEDKIYMMTTAATHIGNSGGPIFSLETGEVEGILSKVYMSGRAAQAVVSHMGLSVKRTQIFDFLKESPLYR
jgi:hypothetical protein